MKFLSWLKSLRSPSRQCLPRADVFACYDKLREVLPQQDVTLFRLRFNDSTEAFFVSAVLRGFTIGKSGNEYKATTPFRYLGPIGRGEFITVGDSGNLDAVNTFLRATFFRLPDVRWDHHSYPQRPADELWLQPDECFCDALLHAKRNGGFPLIVHGENGGHAASVRVIGHDAWRVTDAVRPLGRKYNSANLRELAAHILPTTPATIIRRIVL